ncbi:hypothetical protein BH09BAC3_BH09BAC3_10650 [soil metagenome]
MAYKLKLSPDWKLINALSEIDKFGGSWASIEKKEGQSLKQLKSIATVLSVAASTRIEGSKMTDGEVGVLLENLQISKLEERDEQEVAGYFEVLEIITESYRDIPITEDSIKGLHNILLKHSEKDAWHRGNYKQLHNVVEGHHQDGSSNVIYSPPQPGFETEDAMRDLIAWYNVDKETHTIVRAALFVYDFLSIHPFQDGNGRLSRLIGTLLSLKHGYTWIQYVSFEHEIENQKIAYYQVLKDCQSKRPGEDVYPWVMFFLGCLSNIQGSLMTKLETKSALQQLAPREKLIYQFIENHAGAKSGQISDKLAIPLPTVKRILTDMVTQRLLEKHGIGPGTSYTIEQKVIIKTDIMFTLNNETRRKQFEFNSKRSFVELKKIILHPLFAWTKPDEWSSMLYKQGLSLEVTCRNKNGGTFTSKTHSIAGYNNPAYYQPVFSLSNHLINISSDLGRPLIASDFPITATIELKGTVPNFDFDVNVVYDALIE